MNRPRISLIVAIARNGVIGRQGGLAWHLPADLRHFRQITTGHPIIMGRKTYESIGRPLPGRQNIIVTRDVTFKAEGCQIVHSLDEALQFVNHASEVFIIGGANLYAQTLALAHKLHVTHIDATIEGDVYFPEMDWNQWRQTMQELHAADDKNAYNYAFTVYERQGM